MRKGNKPSEDRLPVVYVTRASWDMIVNLRPAGAAQAEFRAGQTVWSPHFSRR